MVAWWYKGTRQVCPGRNGEGPGRQAGKGKGRASPPHQAQVAQVCSTRASPLTTPPSHTRHEEGRHVVVVAALQETADTRHQVWEQGKLFGNSWE